MAALVVLAGLSPAAANPSPAVVAPAIELSVARSLLPAAEACDDVACLIERAYRADRKAGELALALWTESGDLAGVGPDEVMDGGYRGRIHLVPQLPVAGYRRHLAWVAQATRSIDGFFGELFTGQSAPRYRWRDLAFRFVRSVGKRTPSAYATGWAIEYNVEGSLHTSAAGVLDTVFHELFHTNDEAHGDWSARHLQADYDAILAGCGPRPRVSCLAPYAPNDTMVRGGTYYAFQQNNGNEVHEYAAELAVRYFKEQREMLANGK
ncbi:MAG TPA: hypothetical protein VFK02_27365, partial [Kofleriaceae bacterium]|nr:hypothetical protein [Kofleriaceae bacterium]